jgi:hypothetical protein
MPLSQESEGTNPEEKGEWAVGHQTSVYVLGFVTENVRVEIGGRGAARLKVFFLILVLN